MKIFVAGGAGFIGSNFIRLVMKRHKNAHILNFDKLTYSGNLKNLADVEKSPRYRFMKGDIAHEKQVSAAILSFRPDYLINFAAETHVDRSIHVGAKEFIDTNINGVFNFLEAVKKNKFIKKYLQVSTDEVYGSLSLSTKKKFTEETAFAPNVPYAATKAGGDMLCRAYFTTFHIPVVVTHASNNYGPYQYPEKIIPFFISRLLENKKLPLYGTGKNVRDWLHVDDHCEALMRALFHGVPGEVYNIGSGNERSNEQIAGMILKYFKKGPDCIEYVVDRPGHDLRYAIDPAKTRRELGWKPKYTVEEGLPPTIAWYIAHEEWVNDIRRRTGVFNPHIDLWKAHKLSAKTKNKK